MASSLRLTGRFARLGVALAIFTGIGLGAHAAPNPRCPGACSGSGGACGGTADCVDAGTCVFADACLPGLAALVSEVIPDRPGGPNDPTEGWVCGLGTCAVGPDGLAYSSPFGVDAQANKDFSVAPGGRVLVTLRARVTAGGWGYLALEMPDGGTARETVRGPAIVGDTSGAWQSVTLFADLETASSGALRLAVHASGGVLELSDVTVLTLRPYDLYVRFRLVAPAAPATFHDRVVLRHTDAGPAPHFCADDEDDTGSNAPNGEGCLDPMLIEGEATAGEATAWLPVGQVYRGGRRATHAWEVRDPLTGAPMVGPLTVHTDVAWAPADDSVIWSDEHAIGLAGAPATLGLVLPEGPPSPHALHADIGLVAAMLAGDLDVLPPEGARPAGFAVGALVNVGDAFGTPGELDPAVRAALPVFARLGLNLGMFLTLDPSTEALAEAHAQGLRANWIDGRALLEPLTEGALDVDGGATDVPAELRATLNVALGPTTPLGRAAARGPEGLHALATLGNLALGGLRFAGPAYRGGFAPWLQAEGVTLADLGAASWDAVLPLENATLDTVRAARPDPFEVPKAKHYVWAVRYWNQANALVLRGIAERFADHGIAFAPDLGSPLDDGAAGGAWLMAGGVEAATLATRHGINGAMVDAGLAGAGDCRAWELGLVADWATGFALPLRDAARSPADAPFGALVDVERASPTQRVFELAARGFGWFGQRAYGPYDFTATPAAGGLGADAKGWFEAVAAANDALAKAEIVLAGVQRAPASTILIASQSETLWHTGPAADANLVGWHAALTQAHWNVDVLPESELENGALQHPGRPRRLALALTPHLSDSAWQALRTWVEGGGTLVVGPDLPIYDAFGQRVFKREEWLGIALSERRQVHAGIIDWNTSGSQFGFAYSGAARIITAAEGERIGIDAQDATVALRITRGLGRVVVLGLELGRTFLASASCEPDRPAALARYASGFPDEMRRAMASLPVSAGLVRPVSIDRNDVVAHVVYGPAGGALVLVSYAPGPVQVTVTARDLAECASVEDLVTAQAHTILSGSFSLTLDHAAVLTWDASDCQGFLLAEPAEAEAADVAEPAPRDPGGCASGDAPIASWAGWMIAVAGLARRSRRRRRSPAA